MSQTGTLLSQVLTHVLLLTHPRKRIQSKDELQFPDFCRLMRLEEPRFNGLKMAPDSKNRLKFFGTVIFGAGLLTIASGLAYSFLAPREFEAVVRIRPEKQDWSRSVGSTNYTRGREDPGFIHTEYHLLLSEPIVD